MGINGCEPTGGDYAMTKVRRRGLGTYPGVALLAAAAGGCPLTAESWPSMAAAAGVVAGGRRRRGVGLVSEAEPTNQVVLLRPGSLRLQQLLALGSADG